MDIIYQTYLLSTTCIVKYLKHSITSHIFIRACSYLRKHQSTLNDATTIVGVAVDIQSSDESLSLETDQSYVRIPPSSPNKYCFLKLTKTRVFIGVIAAPFPDLFHMQTLTIKAPKVQISAKTVYGGNGIPKHPSPLSIFFFGFFCEDAVYSYL